MGRAALYGPAVHVIRPYMAWHLAWSLSGELRADVQPVWNARQLKSDLLKKNEGW